MKEKKSEKYSSKEIVASVLAIVLLVIAVIGVSYAVWSGTFLGTKTNSITTGYISFTYTEGSTNVINIQNAAPMNDATGKVLSGTDSQFDFTVSATFSGVSTIDYEVYATPITSTLDEKYIKVYLTDENNNAMSGYNGEVPLYSSLQTSEDGESKTIFTGTLTELNQTQKLRLRVWLASNYDVAEDAKTFSFKVNVKANA